MMFGVMNRKWTGVIATYAPDSTIIARLHPNASPLILGKYLLNRVRSHEDSIRLVNLGDGYSIDIDSEQYVKGGVHKFFSEEDLYEFAKKFARWLYIYKPEGGWRVVNIENGACHDLRDFVEREKREEFFKNMFFVRKSEWGVVHDF